MKLWEDRLEEYNREAYLAAMLRTKMEKTATVYFDWLRFLNGKERREKVGIWDLIVDSIYIYSTQRYFEDWEDN